MDAYLLSECAFGIVLPMISSLLIHLNELPRFSLCLYKLIYIFGILVMARAIGCVTSNFLAPRPALQTFVWGIGLITLFTITFDLFSSPISFDKDTNDPNKKKRKSAMILIIRLFVLFSFIFTIAMMCHLFNFNTDEDSDGSFSSRLNKYFTHCNNVKFKNSFSLFFVPNSEGEGNDGYEE